MLWEIYGTELQPIHITTCRSYRVVGYGTGLIMHETSTWAKGARQSCYFSDFVFDTNLNITAIVPIRPVQVMKNEGRRPEKYDTLEPKAWKKK